MSRAIYERAADLVALGWIQGVRSSGSAVSMAGAVEQACAEASVAIDENDPGLVALQSANDAPVMTAIAAEAVLRFTAETGFA